MYGDPDRLGSFGLALQEATLNYEAAKADYDKLVNGSTDEEIAVYRSQLKESQTALAAAKAGSTAEQIAQAQADVLSAQAALTDLKAGATPEQIAVAEASVKAAEVDVAKAQLELSKTDLQAPFGGTVGQINMNEGEMVSAGVALVSVADVSTWQIETDDLNELDVIGVMEGATVKISVDALPGEVLEGRVVRITPQSVTKAGDVTYTVLIDITGGDTSRLRWGMTTFVDIDVSPAS